jgi:hydroxyacylglutathione hydrolase
VKVPALEPIARGVWLLRGGLLKSMNVYFLEDEGGVTLFDAGEKGMAKPILAAAERMGGLRRVVLGHGDTDHRGSAPALAAAGVPVLCHPDAVREAEGPGGRDYWDMSKLPPAVRALHRVLHRFVWDGGPVRVTGTVQEGDRIAGFEVVLLHGHAPGLIGLWRAEDRLALVSDTVYLTTMWGRPTTAHVPNAAYNADQEQARRSVARLAGLDPAIVAVGHLGPMTGAGVRAELEAAAR